MLKEKTGTDMKARQTLHAAAATDADTGKVVLLQLREDDRQTLVDALGIVAERLEVVLYHAVVVDNIRFTAARRSRDGEAEHFLLSRLLEKRLYNGLDDQPAVRFTWVEQAVEHGPAGLNVERICKLLGFIAEDEQFLT